MHVPGLYIAEVPGKGRGMFCADELSPGDIIESCPIIKIPHDHLPLIDETRLHDYYFLWEEPGYKGCIALGYGSIYNHSSTPNAEFTFDYVDSRIKFHAVSDIEAGAEICFDYTGGGLRPASSLWFDVLK